MISVFSMHPKKQKRSDRDACSAAIWTKIGAGPNSGGRPLAKRISGFQSCRKDYVHAAMYSNSIDLNAPAAVAR